MAGQVLLGFKLLFGNLSFSRGFPAGNGNNLAANITGDYFAIPSETHGDSE